MKKKSLKRCLKKRMILLLGFLMMTGVAVAQQLQVQGKVTDATGYILYVFSLFFCVALPFYCLFNVTLLYFVKY